eukprot:1950041-Amphidinium_carterae.1
MKCKSEGTTNRQLLRFADFCEAREESRSTSPPAATSAGTGPETVPTTARTDASAASSPGSALKRASWTLKDGKHQGKSFAEIYEEDRMYCDWVVKTIDSDASQKRNILRMFAEYVNAKDAVPEQMPN